MNVDQIMSHHLVTVWPEQRVDDVRALFHDHSFHHLLVLEHGKLAGIISDRDLLRNISPFLGKQMAERRQDLSLLDRKAHQIMTRKPVTVTPTTPINEAARIMLECNVSCLPVVDAQSTPVGIVTSKDLLRALCEQSEHAVG